MEPIARNITDLADDERVVIERVVGKHLSENQRIVVRVLDADADANGQGPRTAAEYAILADLDDSEADLLDKAMTKRSPGRNIPL